VSTVDTELTPAVSYNDFDAIAAVTTWDDEWTIT
jgi:hypothetical protein